MSHSPFLTALRAELRTLTVYDALAVGEFCTQLRSEPRFFGPNAEPKAPALSASRLLHPAGPPCVGAFIGDTLVGLGRLSSPGPERPMAELLVVVRSPWRRAGIGTRIVKCLVHDEGVRDLGQAAIEVARNNRAALGLGRACGMERTELAPDRVRLVVPLGRPVLRVA